MKRERVIPAFLLNFIPVNLNNETICFFEILPKELRKN
jgi:hypothetical protein